MKKIVSSGKRMTTVNLDGTECEVVFSSGYNVFSVKSENTVTMALESGKSQDDDGVINVPAGDSRMYPHMRGLKSVFITGTGKVEVFASNEAINPFKSAPVNNGGVMNIMEFEAYLRSIMKVHYTQSAEYAGVYVSDNTRNAIATPQIYPYSIYITADSGYNISVQHYSTNKTGSENRIYKGDWVQSERVPANTWFCLILRRSDNWETTINDNNCFNVSL